LNSRLKTNGTSLETTKNHNYYFILKDHLEIKNVSVQFQKCFNSLENHLIIFGFTTVLFHLDENNILVDKQFS